MKIMYFSIAHLQRRRMNYFFPKSPQVIHSLSQVSIMKYKAINKIRA